MSNVIGQLELQMVADLARIKQDMEAAKGIVGNASAEMQRYANMAAKALGAIGVAVGLNQFRQMIGGFIDAAESLHDLSIQTGATVESLSAMQAIGRTTDTSVESISAAMNKLAKNMAVANEESKGTGQALQALGIDFDKFRAMKPDQQMQALAQAFDKFQDGGSKSAVAMTLLGKEGAKMLPFMKDLAGTGQLVATVTTEQAAAADAYNDSLTVSKMRMEAVQRQMAMGLLPAMVSMHELTTELGRVFGDYLTRDLDKAGKGIDAISLLMAGAGYSMEALMVVSANVGFVLKTVVGQVLAVREANSLIMKGDVEGGKKVWQDFKDGAAKSRTELDAFESKVIGTTDRMLAAREALKSHSLGAAENGREMSSLAGRYGGATKAVLDFGAATKEGADTYAKLLEQYRKLAEAGALRATELQAEADGGRKLTAAEKDYIKVMTEVRDGKVKLIDLDRQGTLAILQRSMAIEQQLAIEKEAGKVRADIAKVSQAFQDAESKTTESMRASVVAIATENDRLRLGERAWLAREKAVTLSQAADLEWQAANEGGNRQLEEQARLLRERAALAGEGVALKEAQAVANEWQKTADSIANGLTDAILRGFEQGKGGVQSFLDAVKALFKTTILKIAISPVQSGLNSFVGGLFGQPQAQGASGGLLGNVQGLSSLYGYGSQAGGYLNAGALASNAAVYSGSAYGTGFASQQSAMLAAQEAGMTSSAGAASSAAAAGWAAAIAAGVFKANSDYNEGFNIGGARQVGRDTFGISGKFEAVQADLLKSLGVSDRLASLLSGSTAVSRIIGRAAPQVTEQGLTGTLGGQSGASLQEFAIWVAKGGWLRSDKSGTDYAAADAKTASTLSGQARAIVDAAAAYGKALGLPTAALSSVTTSFRVALTGNAEADQKAVEAEFRKFSDAVFGSYSAALEPLKKAGESIEQTLVRLVGLQNFSKGLNDLGGVFSRVAALGVDARESFIAMAGGMDALAAKAQSFVQNYYNRDEIAGVKAREVQQALAGAGITQDLSTREQFRALVEAQDISTAAGREQLATLLNVSDAFASLTDYLTETGATLGGVAAQAPEITKLGGLFVDGSTAQVQATNAVQAAVEQARDAIVQALQDQMAAQNGGAGGSLYDNGSSEVNQNDAP